MPIEAETAGAFTTEEGGDALLKCMDKLTLFIDEKRSELDNSASESLFSNLGSLTSQADMILQLEQIAEPSAQQIDLLRTLRIQGAEMVRLVDQTISQLSPEP